MTRKYLGVDNDLRGRSHQLNSATFSAKFIFLLNRQINVLILTFDFKCEQFFMKVITKCRDFKTSHNFKETEDQPRGCLYRDILRLHSWREKISIDFIGLISKYTTWLLYQHNVMMSIVRTMLIKNSRHIVRSQYEDFQNIYH